MVGWMCIDFLKHFQNLFIRCNAKRTQKRGHRNFALSINLYPDHVFWIRFKLKPRSAVWNDFCSIITAATVNIPRKKCSGGTHELRHNHTFYSVNHEGSARGHDWEVPQINFLFLHGFTAKVDQTCFHAQRRFIRHVLQF